MRSKVELVQMMIFLPTCRIEAVGGREKKNTKGLWRHIFAFSLIPDNMFHLYVCMDSMPVIESQVHYRLKVLSATFLEIFLADAFDSEHAHTGTSTSIALALAHTSATCLENWEQTYPGMESERAVPGYGMYKNIK